MSDDYEVGWGRPPKHSQWPPNQSGNKRGRPPGKLKTLPYAKVLDPLLIVHENGKARWLPADQAFVLATLEMGMTNPAISKICLTAIANKRLRSNDGKSFPDVIICCYADKGDPKDALRILGMARLQDAYRDTARLMLEPWIVEQQLALLGNRQLTEDQQAVIIAATRLPHKVKWPVW